MDVQLTYAPLFSSSAAVTSFVQNHVLYYKRRGTVHLSIAIISSTMVGPNHRPVPVLRVYVLSPLTLVPIETNAAIYTVLQSKSRNEYQR
jgi:hypothetical protein